MIIFGIIIIFLAYWILFRNWDRRFMDYKIIDPLKISTEDTPLIMLVDNRNAFVSWLIKWHTKGEYNHICEMHRLGFLATQDPIGFHEVPIETYMKKNLFLKFWKFKNITLGQKTDWLHNIVAEIHKPWIKRRYDFVGLIGQLLNIRWINNTWTKYCSEMVRSHILEPLKLNIALHITPSEFNDYFNRDSNFEVYGYWFMD